MLESKTRRSGVMCHQFDALVKCLTWLAGAGTPASALGFAATQLLRPSPRE